MMEAFVPKFGKPKVEDGEGIRLYLFTRAASASQTEMLAVLAVSSEEKAHSIDQQGFIEVVSARCGEGDKVVRFFVAGQLVDNPI